MFKHRYRRILWFFARVLLHLTWWDIFLPKIGLRRLASRNRAERMIKIAVNFRALAVDMGGVMIKVGQLLSSRLDILPREITTELAGLQDEVRPERYEDIRAVAEAELGAPLDTLFEDFDPEPLAAASIGQVHTAHIRMVGEDGKTSLQKVVVKVQRPRIAEIVEVDLSALKVVAGWVNLYRPIRRRANVPMLTEEFARTLREEVDYLNEGKNAERFAENFKQRSDVIVPRVFWKFTTRQVLTLENVRAIRIGDYEALDRAGIDRGEVADRLFDTYLQQIFDDKFFHADPHPGNLFIQPTGEANGKTTWKLVFIDFGMMGTVASSLFDGLRELLLAVGLRDGARVVKGYQTLNALLPGADLELLERASNAVFDRFWGKTAPEMVDMHQEEAEAFIREFGDLLYDMPFQLPENMILLGRCLSILSGMCTGLYRDFNLWKNIAPYAQKLVEAEKGSGVKAVLNEAMEILRTTISLPNRATALIARLEQGKLDVRTPDLKQQIALLNQTGNRLVGAILFLALMYGGIQFHQLGWVELSYAAGAGAVLALLYALLHR